MKALWIFILFSAATGSFAAEPSITSFTPVEESFRIISQYPAGENMEEITWEGRVIFSVSDDDGDSLGAWVYININSDTILADTMWGDITAPPGTDREIMFRFTYFHTGWDGSENIRCGLTADDENKRFPVKAEYSCPYWADTGSTFQIGLISADYPYGSVDSVLYDTGADGDFVYYETRICSVTAPSAPDPDFRIAARIKMTDGHIIDDTLKVAVVKGAAAPSEILTGFPDSVHHFGMVLFDSSFYLTGWLNNGLTIVNLSNGAPAGGFPATLPSVDLPHGVMVDTDSTIWICDLNNSSIRHYSPELTLIESFNIGSQPVNMIKFEETYYIADRVNDRVYIFDGTTVTDSFDVEALDSSLAGGYIDMFPYGGKIYMVSDEIDGFSRMNPDGTSQEIISIRSNEPVNGMGIHVKDENVYINAGSFICVTDSSGGIINRWDINIPEGFEGSYIDLEIIGNRIYIASAWGINFDTNTKDPHLLVFEEN
ncbi:MAG: hypothetical protein ACLFQK_02190 [Fibrobacterota bacterium]